MQKGFAPALIIVGVLIIMVVAGGAYFLGKQATPKTFQPVQPTIGLQISPTISNNQPTQIPTSSVKKVTIPSNWKQFTAEDPDFGIKTIMSLPPGFSFRFTGSEFTIQNDSDATELWDYSSSVYRDNDGVLKNHYDGSSRRAWYENYLDSKRGLYQSKDKILGVSEVPLNNISYLKISIEVPAYNSSGVKSGTKIGTHFLYVQNNILHMISPASNKSFTKEAQIPTNIGLILTSLSSIQTK